jgi:hypothetical protein
VWTLGERVKKGVVEMNTRACKQPLKTYRSYPMVELALAAESYFGFHDLGTLEEGRAFLPEIKKI